MDILSKYIINISILNMFEIIIKAYKYFIEKCNNNITVKDFIYFNMLVDANVIAILKLCNMAGYKFNNINRLSKLTHKSFKKVLTSGFHVHSEEFNRYMERLSTLLEDAIEEIVIEFKH